MWWIVSLKSNGIYCPNDYLLLFKPHLLNNLTVEAKTQSHSSWSSPDLPPSQVIISWTFLPFIFLIQTSLLLGSWYEVVWVLCLHLSPLLVLHLWVCQHWIPSVFFFRGCTWSMLTPLVFLFYFMVTPPVFLVCKNWSPLCTWSPLT